MHFGFVSRYFIVLDRSKLNVTFTGNVSLYQNLENVLYGFKLANISDCILNIVGDGSDIDHLKQIVKSKSIDNVVFYGRRPANEMYDVLMQSDALLLSLISDSGREIIEEYNLGLCAHPNDINEIASTFSNIMKLSKSDRESIADNAKILMNTRFNREAIFQNFLTL